MIVEFMDYADEKKGKFEDMINGTGGSAPALTRDELQMMLETLTKDQLVDLLVDVGFQYDHVLDRIIDLASRDPVHRKLFVRGLAWETTTETLRDAFSQYGEIEEGAVIIDKATGKSRGFGFITYKQTDSAHRALREPSKRIDGRITICNLAAQGHINHGTLTDVALRKVYVGSLAYETTTETLLSFFSQYGDIEEGAVAYDKNTNKSRGFAFVTFKHVEGARRATLEPTKIIDGRQVMVKIAAEAQKEKLASHFLNSVSNLQHQNSSSLLFPSYGTGYNMPGVHQPVVGSGLGNFRSRMNLGGGPLGLSATGFNGPSFNVGGLGMGLDQDNILSFNTQGFGPRETTFSSLRGGLEHPAGGNGASLYFPH